MSVVEGFRTYGSLWETLSVISQVSAVEGCPLGGVPLYPNQELGVRAVEPCNTTVVTVSLISPV